MIYASQLLLLGALVFFVWRRLRRYLHIFQQEEYTARRFLRWMFRTRSFDRYASLVFLGLGLLPWELIKVPSWVFLLLAAAVFVFFGWREIDPRKVAKKKLVMTFRARRTFAIAFALSVLVGTVIGIGSGSVSVLPWIVAIQFVPLSLCVANLLLLPFEKIIQARIVREASEVLASVDPTVIGITGSFGKTSLKHVLGHVLKLNASALFTPGSVNTLMGISRVIRESLTPGTKFFLVEMGAYAQGSIARLCRLTPPSCGIITALGEAHYERFGSMDAVASAKFELAEAVLAQKEGKIVVHESVIEQPVARAFVEAHRDRFLVCGRGAGSDLVLGAFAQTGEGITVSVVWEGKTYELFSPLYGSAHADNLALAFAAAAMCGVEPDRIVAALRTVAPIAHRLEVKPQASGMTYIDDAYNSNPRGFEAALDLLGVLGAERGGQKILVTPGIIELGERNDAVHGALGRKAAEIVDRLFVVRSDRIPALAAEFRAAAPDKPLVEVDSFVEAQRWVRANAGPTDVVLLENDLLDVDEARLVL